MRSLKRKLYPVEPAMLVKRARSAQSVSFNDAAAIYGDLESGVYSTDDPQAENDNALLDAVLRSDIVATRELMVSLNFTGQMVDQISLSYDSQEDVSELSLLDIAITQDDFEIAQLLYKFGAREINSQLRIDPLYEEFIRRLEAQHVAATQLRTRPS